MLCLYVGDEESIPNLGKHPWFFSLLNLCYNPEFWLISSKHEEKKMLLFIIVPIYIYISLIVNKEDSYLTEEVNSVCIRSASILRNCNYFWFIYYLPKKIKYKVKCKWWKIKWIYFNYRLDYINFKSHIKKSLDRAAVKYTA